MGVPFDIRTVNDQLAASMYGSQFRGVRLFDQDVALFNDANAPEVVMRDSATSATMDQFCHEIAATGNTVMPGGKDDQSAKWAQIVDEMLRGCNVREAVYELSSYVFWGRAYAFPNFRRKFEMFAETKPQNWLAPYEIRDIDHRQFIFVPVRDTSGASNGHIRVKRQFAPANTGRYTDEKPEFTRNVIELKWGDSAFRLGYGRGLINSIFFMWRAKTIAMQYGLQGLQRWAEGLLMVEMDIERPADSSLTNEALAADMLDKIRNMKSGNVAVLPKGSEPKLHETSGTGHSIVAWFINYCDAQIARLILGSGMPTGAGEEAGSAGSEGKAVVQERSTTRRIQFHRSRIEECIDRTLIKQIHDLNLPQRLAIGLGAAKCPRFKITDDQHKDPLAAMELVKAMRENKMEVDRAWAYEMAGAPMPKEGDDVLEAAADPNPFLGLGGDEGTAPVGAPLPKKPNGGPKNEDRPANFKEAV